jgi:hypothetical protein
LLNDADANPTNEIQDLSLSGNTLSLSSDATPVDLAPYLDNTDNQTLNTSTSGSTVTVGISNGNSVNFDNNDADADPVNELQNLSLSGNNLSISGGNSVSLATYVNTDNQTLTFNNGNRQLSISNGNTVTLPNDQQTLSLSGTTLTISGSGGNSVNLPTDLWSLIGAGPDIKRTTGNVFIGDVSSTNSDLYLSGRLVDWDNSGYNMDLDATSRLNNVVVNTLDFSPSIGTLPNTDGILYRYAGQSELMVDDWFYLRDNSGTVRHRFNTDAGDIDVDGVVTARSGLRTEKNYLHYKRTRGNGSGGTDNLGNWDMCYLAGADFRNNDSYIDEDDDYQCNVYPNFATTGSSEGNNETTYNTTNYANRPYWYLYSECYSDCSNTTCSSICINFD